MKFNILYFLYKKCVINWLNRLGLHLSMAKMLGSKSFSYFTIEPSLVKMDLLAGNILQDLQSNPSEWIDSVRIHKSELIKSFYLTVADRPKVRKK